MNQDPLAPFPPSWPATRAALHGYSAALVAVPRAHAAPQPHWGHVGMRLEGQGLVTSPVDLPDGRTLALGLDPSRHIAWIDAGEQARHEMRLDSGATATEFGAEVLDVVIGLGLADTFDRGRFESDDPASYDTRAAGFFWETLRSVESVLAEYRAGLDRQPAPVHLWSHHFDMSFEWYGTRMVAGEDGSEAPAQLNLGFYPGDEQYFYSNPWPFDDGLVGTPLPPGAAWHTEGWKGTILPYEAMVGDPAWRDRLLEYASAVHRITRPTLMV
jgi:hypothetical protein